MAKKSAFQPKPEITAAVNKIVEECKALSRGDILYYTTIEELTGLNRESKSWGNITNKVRKRIMNERGIVLAAETSVGFRFLTVHEQLLHRPQYRAKRGQRQFQRGRTEVSSTPDSECSLQQRQLKVGTIQTLTRARREALRAGRIISSINKPKQTNPRRQPMPSANGIN